MKEKLLFIFIIFAFFSFSSRVFAVESCSPKGYTILTINGIFTDLEGAIRNKDSLSFKFSKPFNNQSIKVDYLYNPSHLAGLADLIDTVKQGFFDQKSDYDLVEMLNDASQKVTTQKLLLVAHSQGNFYANNFYDKTASQPGGVPSQSIGVYGVASPANRVTGGGKYLTSDTDNVVASVVARYINILSPNIHIPLSSLDGNGHSFSDVYLKYQGDRIVSDIKSSLDKLKENDEQIPQDPCISPPELSVIHKVQGVVLAVADPLANFTKTIATNTVVTSYKVASAIGNGVLSGVSSAASAITSLFNNNKNLALNIPAAASLAIDQATNQESENIIPKIVKDGPSPKVIKPLPSDNVSNVSSDKTNVIKNPAPVVIDPVIPPAGVVSVVSPKNVSSIFYGGGSGGGSGPVYIAPPDNTPPVISIIGANSLDIEKDTTYTDAGATVLDDVDGVLVVEMSGTVNTAVIGTYIITYSATDLSGNISSLTRMVKVVATPDATAPVISIMGDDSVTIVVGSTYTDAGATALDEKDGDITSNIVAVNPVDVNTIADYMVTYDVKDLAKNSATQVVRLVHVVSLPDITPPVITILGNKSETIKLGSAYSDAGAEAVDDVDEDITEKIITTNLVNTSLAGSYTVTYDVSDAHGNAATQMTRTVNVRAPFSAKEITAFSFENSLDTTINENVRTITVTMPSGTDLTALVPNITQNGVSVYPQNGIATDFTNPVTYIVTAEDSSKQNYVVIADVTPASSADYFDNTPGKLTGGSYLNFNPNYTDSSNYGRVWYMGHYPDTSHIIVQNNYPTMLAGNTLGCGQICTTEFSNRVSTYYWVGIYTDNTNTRLIHYTEVFDTAVGVDWQRFNISNQGNVSNGTCSDGIKNQDETDVDVGGICIMKTLQRDYACIGDCDYLDVAGKTKKGSVLYFSPNLYLVDFGRVWYSGRYPDTSNAVRGNNYPASINLQSLPCGHLCGVKTPQYFWIGLYPNATSTNLAHYVEVYYSGNFTDQWDKYYITRQSE